MSFAIFRCCPTSIFLEQYETSTDAVLKILGLAHQELKDFNCCGYPLKNVNFNAFILSSARNLSLAARRNLEIVTLCSCCYGNLRQAQRLLAENASLQEKTKAALEKEGLACNAAVPIKHFLELLTDDFGLEQIQSRLVHKYEGLNLAVQYGCHLLRPKEILPENRALSPSSLDRLVEITGARSMDWQEKAECCGSPIWGVYDELSMNLAESKIQSAARSGAQYFCTACVYCQLQFDRVQRLLVSKGRINDPLPSILFPQLLGLALGIDGETLGIHRNLLDLSGISAFMT